MKLKELNKLTTDMELMSFMTLVEKYQQEYDILVETGQLDESLDGAISWMKEQAEIGSFIKKLLQNPTILNKVTFFINGKTEHEFKKPLAKKLNDILAKIEKGITNFTNNPTVLNIFLKIKNGIIKLKNLILHIYAQCTNISLSGFKKLAGSIAMSALFTKIFDEAKIIDFFQKFSIDSLKEKAIEMIETQFTSFESFVDSLTTNATQIFNTFKNVGANVAGLGVVVEMIVKITGSVKLTYSILKAAKIKYESSLVNSDSAVPAPA